MAFNDPRTLPARVRVRFEDVCRHLGVDADPVLRQFDSWQYPARDLAEMDGWPDATVEAHIRALVAEIAESKPPVPPAPKIVTSEAADEPDDVLSARARARFESTCLTLGFDDTAEVLGMLDRWRFTSDELHWLDSLDPGSFADTVRELSCEALEGRQPGIERLPAVMARLRVDALT